MSDIIIKPSNLSGKIRVAPKNISMYGAIMCATLSGGVSNIYNVVSNYDIEILIRAVNALGAKYCFTDNRTLHIDASNILKIGSALLCCDKSKTTADFLLPILSMLNGFYCISSQEHFFVSGLKSSTDCLSKSGVIFGRTKQSSLSISGKLRGNKFYLTNEMSLQFVGGLLIALPLADTNSEIILDSTFELDETLEIILEIMKSFRVVVEKTDNGYKIQGNQSYKPCNYTPEGDWSRAIFWITAGVISPYKGNKIEILGLKAHSCQKNRAIVDILKNMNADIVFDNDRLIIGVSDLKAIEQNANISPEIFLHTCICSVFANGLSNILGIYELDDISRNNLVALLFTIDCLGIKSRITGNSIWFEGIRNIIGEETDCFKNAIVTMLTVMFTVRCDTPFVIHNIGNLDDIYPEFFEDYKSLGGKMYEVY